MHRKYLHELRASSWNLQAPHQSLDLKKLVKNGVISKDERIVCVTTGHGLKDPDTAVKMSEKPIEVEAEMSAIEDALGLKRHAAILAR